jgi:hypothetical protein
MFAIPASASVQTLDTTGEQCRVTQAPDSPNTSSSDYLWFCDGPSTATYTEWVIQGAGFSEIMVGDMTNPKQTSFSGIAFGHRDATTDVITWDMYDHKGSWVWHQVGPTTWASSAYNT